MRTVLIKGGSSEIFRIAKEVRTRGRYESTILGDDKRWYYVCYMQTDAGHQVAVVFRTKDPTDLSCLLLPTRWSHRTGGPTPVGNIEF